MNNLTFSEYIRGLDSKTVLEHLLENQSEGVLGESVYLQVEEKYLSPESISERWKSLSDELKRSLFRVYLTGRIGLPASQLANSSDRMILLQSFLVYESTRSGMPHVMGFSDLFNFLNEFISEDISLGQNGVTMPRDSGVLPDSALLLSLVKNGRVKRRQDGILQKSSIEDFFKASVLQIFVSSAQDAVPFIELILHFMVKHDIIRLDVEGFYPAPDSEEKWGDLIPDWEMMVLEEASGLVSFAQTPMIRSFFEVAGACSIDETRWWNADTSISLLLWCGELATDQKHIGLGSGKIEKIITTGHIMPDFSVMIPREIAPQELLQFFDIGEITSVDVIYKGKVSKTSVVNSLSRGVSGPYLLEIFSRWNASPHLLHTVQEWIYSFERVFVDGHYLAMKESVAEHLIKTPELQGIISEVPEYRFFRVTPGREQEIVNTLEKMGFDTRFPHEEEQRKVEHNKSNLELIFPAKPVFSPELERKEPVKTNFGRYGGALKKCNAGELLKVVRYAIFMDEKLAVLSEGESEPVVISPIDIKTGENGELSGNDSQGNKLSISLDVIDKIGVVSDS